MNVFKEFKEFGDGSRLWMLTIQCRCGSPIEYHFTANPGSERVNGLAIHLSGKSAFVMDPARLGMVLVQTEQLLFRDGCNFPWDGTIHHWLITEGVE
jgi:hypothetical protein